MIFCLAIGESSSYGTEGLIGAKSRLLCELNDLLCTGGKSDSLSWD